MSKFKDIRSFFTVKVSSKVEEAASLEVPQDATEVTGSAASTASSSHVKIDTVSDSSAKGGSQESYFLGCILISHL